MVDYNAICYEKHKRAIVSVLCELKQWLLMALFYVLALMIGQEKTNTPSIITMVTVVFVWLPFGGDEGIRTLDLSDANRTLSQLSYAPICGPLRSRKWYYTTDLQFVKGKMPEQGIIFCGGQGNGPARPSEGHRVRLSPFCPGETRRWPSRRSSRRPWPG